MMERMTITEFLLEFLLDRIDEDEAVARAASIPAHDGPNAYKPHPELTRWKYEPWSPNASGEVEYQQTAEMLAHKYGERIYVTCDFEGLSPSVGEDVGPHIARHDPARVLAECEAKRRIVELHRPGGEHEPDACILCQWDIDCEAPRSSHQPGAGAFPCETLRALASVYADHPDFDPAWRVAD